jgi:putative endonuclease
MRICGHTCRSSVIDMPKTDTPEPGSGPGPGPGSTPGSKSAPTRENAAHTDPRRTLGRRGEQLAAEHLHRMGFTSLGRNERTRYGEIDLIAFDGRTLVFVEVKTRRVDPRPSGPRTDQQPLVYLRPRQRIRLRRLATAWLTDAKHIRPSAHTIRFDAIGVMLDSQNRLLRLDHVEGAW